MQRSRFFWMDRTVQISFSPKSGCFLNDKSPVYEYCYTTCSDRIINMIFAFKKANTWKKKYKINKIKGTSFPYLERSYVIILTLPEIMLMLEGRKMIICSLQVINNVLSIHMKYKTEDTTTICWRLLLTSTAMPLFTNAEQ